MYGLRLLRRGFYWVSKGVSFWERLRRRSAFAPSNGKILNAKQVFEDTGSSELSVIVGTSHSWTEFSRFFAHADKGFLDVEEGVFGVFMISDPLSRPLSRPDHPSCSKTGRFALSRWNNRQTRLHDHPSRSKTSKICSLSAETRLTDLPTPTDYAFIIRAHSYVVITKEMTTECSQRLNKS